jgi:hypothetical protein
MIFAMSQKLLLNPPCPSMSFSEEYKPDFCGHLLKEVNISNS